MQAIGPGSTTLQWAVTSGMDDVSRVETCDEETQTELELQGARSWVAYYHGQ